MDLEDGTQAALTRRAEVRHPDGLENGTTQSKGVPPP